MKNILILVALIGSIVLVGCPAKEDDPGSVPTQSETEDAGTENQEIEEPQ